jgi:RNA polymerase subunit RPABC4/transcription elongation factor Spt4
MTNEDSACPKCKTHLEVDAKFCPQCGAKVGAHTCGRCGASTPAGAKFCPGCGEKFGTSLFGKLTGANEEDFSRRREWKRTPEDFASKFEVEDLRGILKKTVTVAEGTRALLFQGGAYAGDLPAGHYTLGNILKAKLPLNLDERATVVLVDNGVVAIDFTFGRSELRTADSVPVGVTGRLTIRNRDSRSFIANLLKGKSRILLTDLQEDLRYDLLGAVQSTLRGYRMDDLYGNLAVKEDIESAVRANVTPTLATYGFSLEQLRFTQSDEAEWHDILEKRSEGTKKVTKTGLDIDIEQKLRHLLSDDKLDRLSTDEKISEYCHELAQAGIVRENEIEDLKIDLWNRRDDKAFIRQIVRERFAQAHRHESAEAEQDSLLGMDAKTQRHRRAMDAEQTGHAIGADDARREHGDKWRRREQQQDRAEIEDLIDLKKQMDDVKLRRVRGEQEIAHKDLDKQTEIEGKKLEQYTNASSEALILTADGGTAEKLVELEKMKRAVTLTEEQIMALSAEKSVAVAEAMKEKFGSDRMRELYETRLQDQQKYMEKLHAMTGENADRLAGVMNKALDAMGQTATARSAAHQAQGSTVVAGGGGLGQSVIVNPVRQEESRVCPGCKTPNSAADRFCKECGEELR